jgi:hypothetical protein
VSYVQDTKIPKTMAIAARPSLLRLVWVITLVAVWAEESTHSEHPPSTVPQRSTAFFLQSGFLKEEILHRVADHPQHRLYSDLILHDLVALDEGGQLKPTNTSWTALKEAGSRKRPKLWLSMDMTSMHDNQENTLKFCRDVSQVLRNGPQSLRGEMETQSAAAAWTAVPGVHLIFHNATNELAELESFLALAASLVEYLQNEYYTAVQQQKSDRLFPLVSIQVPAFFSTLQKHNPRNNIYQKVDRVHIDIPMHMLLSPLQKLDLPQQRDSFEAWEQAVIQQYAKIAKYMVDQERVPPAKLLSSIWPVAHALGTSSEPPHAISLNSFLSRVYNQSNLFDDSVFQLDTRNSYQLGEADGNESVWYFFPSPSLVRRLARYCKDNGLGGVYLTNVSEDYFHPVVAPAGLLSQALAKQTHYTATALQRVWQQSKERNDSPEEAVAMVPIRAQQRWKRRQEAQSHKVHGLVGDLPSGARAAAETKSRGDARGNRDEL